MDFAASLNLIVPKLVLSLSGLVLLLAAAWGGDKAARGIMAMVEEWAKFVAANALGFGVNYAVYVSLVTFAPSPLNSPYVALAFGTLAGLIFNFTLSKRFVFNAAD